jgi:hypothetical protein
MTIKSTHSSDKTYFAVDATEKIRPITTRAFYIPDLQKDLLARRALLKSKYQIIMEQKNSGIFPVVNKEID